MTLQVHFFNIWAVLCAIASNMIIGALWYSPLLFGNVWLRLVGKKGEEIDSSDANASMALSIIPATFSALFLFLILSFAGAASVLDAVIVGSIASLGFAGMSALNLVFFEERSMKLTTLNVGYTFVSYLVAAIILTLWR